jgi:hypothetical protein
MSAGQPDLSNAEQVDYEIEGKEGRTRIRIKEGATLEMRSVVTGVFRIGNDPNTGLPTYFVGSANIVALVNSDKKLRKAVLRQPGKGEGSPSVGVT